MLVYIYLSIFVCLSDLLHFLLWLFSCKGDWTAEKENNYIKQCFMSRVLLLLCTHKHGCLPCIQLAKVKSLCFWQQLVVFLSISIISVHVWLYFCPTYYPTLLKKIGSVYYRAKLGALRNLWFNLSHRVTLRIRFSINIKI